MRWRYVFVIGLASVCSQAEEYFPPLSLSQTQKAHQFRADWYSQQLTSLNEKSLWLLSQKPKADEVYRFLWLRSFHDPVCVRLSITIDGRGLLITKETDGRGGFKPGKLIRDETRSLTQKDVQLFLKHLNVADFWRKSRPQPKEFGVDGANWILEGERSGVYQIIDLWSPPPDDPLRDLGLMLTRRFSQLRLADAEIY